MKHRTTLAILAIFVTAPFVLAAEPAASLHWYQVTLSSGGNTFTLTGSSPLDAAEMSARFTKTEPVALENRREQFADPEHKLGMGWHPYEEGSKLFILPHAVLFFTELLSDPATKSK